MFDALRSRIVEVKGLASRVAAKGAAQLLPIVREHARTSRGNVPLFPGKPKWSADLPITVKASSDAITIRSVDWAMRRMIADGAPEEWLAIVGDIARSIREGR